MVSAAFGGTRGPAPRIEFVSLPPGSFRMGADLPSSYITSEKGVFIQDESPVRQVTIPRGFELAVHEVTNAEYEQFDPLHRALRGKAAGVSTKDREPVVFVTWNEAVAYCRWLSAQDPEHDYRLPTEAEWEYACRAGTRTVFNDGVEGEIYSLNPLGGLAQDWRVITNWFVTRGNRNTDKIAHASPGPVDLTVGQQGPNAWGLFDMHGGVEEWTQDWYGPYAENDLVDPVGYQDGTSKVVRGGSHNVHLQTLRSANRSSALPTDKHCLLGFRVVRVPKGQRLPEPKRRQLVPQWAKDVGRQTCGWPSDDTRPHFQGPISLYAIADAYQTPALETQFRIPLYTHNHSPAITWAENGDLLLVWFTGESEKGQELTILGLRARRQANGSLAWDREVSEFFKAADRNMHGSQLWNNARRRAHGFREPFTLYHINGICTDGKWSKLAMSFRSSTDGGATWTEPVMMKAKTDAFHLDSARNQPQGNVLVTASGNFLAFADGALPGGSGSSVNCSDDGGKTWSVCGQPGPPGIHVAAVELADGRLLAFSRESSGRRGSLPKSLSSDQGRSWTAGGSEFPPIGTVQRVELLRLNYSNPALAPPGSTQVPVLLVSFANRGIPGRDANGQDAIISGAFAAVSWDGGETWPIKRVLSGVRSGRETHVMAAWNEPFEHDSTHGQPKAYWAATQTPDGVVHLTDGCLYYAFNLAWLVADSRAPQAMQPVPDRPGLPRVLLIGDSISIGYTVPVRERLRGKANVHRIPENGGPTTNGLAKLEAWLGTNRWDVIHFNWGLHDLKLQSDGRHLVPVAEYEQNLRLLVQRLQRTGAVLIWATTTPVPPGVKGPARNPADVRFYNTAALRVMRAAGVRVNDLNAFAQSRLPKIQIPQNVHYSAEGSAQLARPVARAIRDALEDRRHRSAADGAR